MVEAQKVPSMYGSKETTRDEKEDHQAVAWQCQGQLAASCFCMQCKKNATTKIIKEWKIK